MRDISNKDISIAYNYINYGHTEGEHSMYLYGKNAFAVVDLKDTSHYKVIDAPMNTANGFFPLNHKKVFLKELKGPRVGLVDIENGQFVAYGKTGSAERKFALAFTSIVTMALTAPTGYMVTPVGGFSRSDNKLFLDRGENRIFAINVKTSDVTSFDAKDMSDKHIIDTGAGTFQLVQASYKDNLPVVAIAQNKATFISPIDGRKIKSITYDKPIEISNNNQSFYRNIERRY